jgi:hypothetical protein
MRLISSLVAGAALGAAAVAVPCAAIAGALGYRHWDRGKGNIAGLDMLGEPGRKVSEGSQALHRAVSASGADPEKEAGSK